MIHNYTICLTKYSFNFYETRKINLYATIKSYPLRLHISSSGLLCALNEDTAFDNNSRPKYLSTNHFIEFSNIIFYKVRFFDCSPLKLHTIELR